MPVEPGEDFARRRMIEGGIADSKRRAPRAEPVEAPILQSEEIAPDPFGQRLAEHRPRRPAEGRAVIIGVAPGVAFDQRQRGNPAQHRLRGGVDAVPRNVRSDQGRPAGEGAQVEVLRHPRAVVDRIIVPQERLSAEPLGDSNEMPRGEFARADLGAGPKNLDCGIEQSAELLEVERRSGAEGAVEDWVVRIIRRAAKDALGDAPLGGEMDDRGLAGGEIGDVAAHVVEQQGQIVGLQRGQLGELGGERVLPAPAGIEVELERAEADAEADALGAAKLAEDCELGQLGLRIGSRQRRRSQPSDFGA